MSRSARVWVGFTLLVTLVLGGDVESAWSKLPEVLSVEVKGPAAPLSSGDSVELEVVATLKPGWHVNAHITSEDFLIPTTLGVEELAGFEAGEPRYPEGHDQRFAFFDKPLSVYDQRFSVFLPLQVGSQAPAGSHTLKGALRYQACNDETCLPPNKAVFELALEVQGERAAAAPVAGTGDAETAGLLASARAKLSQLQDISGVVGSYGYAFAFVVIFLFGLALNGTPCVYPIIPITVGYFATQSEGGASRGRTFALAGMFALGMALMYSSLGAFAALSGRAFGAALQSPWTLGGMAVLMLALASSMFGLWEMQAPAFIQNRAGGSYGGLLGALAMGLTMGVVAAPCVGPFVVGLFTYVAKLGDPLLGWAMFFTLGLGLGLPYLAVAAGLLKLPRSGDWMLWVKHLFGFILIAMALYFVKPLIGAPLFWPLLAAVALAAGVFLGFIDRTGAGRPVFQRVKRGFGVAFVAAGLLAVFMPRMLARPHIPWQEYTNAQLEAAACSDGRPVVIDFTAEWCLPCQQLEHETFSHPDVIAAAGQLLPLKADATTGGSDDVQSAMETLEVAGFPTVVFLDAAGKELEELRIMGFVEPADFLDRLAVLKSTPGSGRPVVSCGL